MAAQQNTVFFIQFFFKCNGPQLNTEFWPSIVHLNLSKNDSESVWDMIVPYLRADLSNSQYIFDIFEVIYVTEEHISKNHSVHLCGFVGNSTIGIFLHYRFMCTSVTEQNSLSPS